MKIALWKIISCNSNAVLEIFMDNDMEISDVWVDDRKVNHAKWPTKFRAAVEKAIAAELRKTRNS